MRHAILSFFCLAALAMLASAPASARPRDEVMSSAYRCAPVGDSRQWLDCYYGAAQPVRAALGLKPAPADQLRLVSAPPAGQPRDLEIRDQVISQATACREFPDDWAWLDCYYGAAQPMRAALGLAPAAQAMASAAPRDPVSPSPVLPQPRQSRRDDGESALPAGVDHVDVRMASYSFSKTGWFTVTLTNGQVWRQVEGDTDQAHWKKPAGAYVAHITPGFLKSYNLQVRGLPGKYKVLPAS